MERCRYGVQKGAGSKCQTVYIILSWTRMDNSLRVGLDSPVFILLLYLFYQFHIYWFFLPPSPFYVFRLVHG